MYTRKKGHVPIRKKHRQQCSVLNAVCTPEPIGDKNIPQRFVPFQTMTTVSSWCEKMIKKEAEKTNKPLGQI
jgi:hypothetical protein